MRRLPARRITGIDGLARDAVALAEAAAPADPDVAGPAAPASRGRRRQPRSVLTAIGAPPRGRGGSPCHRRPRGAGHELFARKLRHTMRDPEITPGGRPGPGRGRVRGGPRGDGPDRPRDLAAVAARRARARRRWRARPRHARCDRGRPSRRGRAGRRSAARSWAGSRRSAASRGIIGLVDEPLEIDWTPEFMRSFGGAMLDSPGPLDDGQKAFFSITPVREEWSAERGRVVPARDERAPAPAADDPRGGPGPLPPGRYAQPRQLARAARVPVRAVRRGLGRLRDAGDAGPRLRRTTTRRCGWSTGSSTCARSPTRSSTSASTPRA